MAVKKLKPRALAGKEQALRTQDPVGEALPQEEVIDDGRVKTLIVRVVAAKKMLDLLSPKVEAANKEYDECRAALDELLIELGIKSVGGSANGYRVVASLSDIEQIKVLDRELCQRWIKAHVPALLTVNTNTLKAWLREEAPKRVQNNPSLLGIEVKKVPQLQLRVTPER